MEINSSKPVVVLKVLLGLYSNELHREIEIRGLQQDVSDLEWEAYSGNE
jgi:hypothetical protein